MFWEVSAIMAALLTWLAAPPAGLGDAAKREAVRRQLTAKSSRAYVVEDFNMLVSTLAPAASAQAAPAVPPSASDAADGGRAVNAPPPATEAVAPASTADAKPPASAQDQETWRNRMTMARDALSRTQILAEAMQSRINALTTDMLNRDDPAQRAKLAADNQRAVDELTRLQKQIVNAEKAIQAIQDDARRQGVPPGWIR